MTCAATRTWWRSHGRPGKPAEPQHHRATDRKSGRPGLRAATPRALAPNSRASTPAAASGFCNPIATAGISLSVAVAAALDVPPVQRAAFDGPSARTVELRERSCQHLAQPHCDRDAGSVSQRWRDQRGCGCDSRHERCQDEVRMARPNLVVRPLAALPGRSDGKLRGGNHRVSNTRVRPRTPLRYTEILRVPVRRIGLRTRPTTPCVATSTYGVFVCVDRRTEPLPMSRSTATSELEPGCDTGRRGVGDTGRRGSGGTRRPGPAPQGDCRVVNVYGARPGRMVLC